MEIITIHSLAKSMLLTKSYTKLTEDVKELMNIEAQIKEIKDVYESMDCYTQLALYNASCNLVDRANALLLETNDLKHAINLLKKMRAP